MRPVSGHFQASCEQLPIGLKHGLGFLGQAKHGPGDRGQTRALLGQLHPSCRAPQQGDLVVLLQGFDVPGDGRLADEQPRRSTGKTALTGDRIKRAELKQVHIYRPDLWLA
ncbi:hypothetical protein D3C72_1987270 [compost metagenome]